MESAEVKVLEWCLHFGFNTWKENERGMNSLHVAAKTGCCTRAELLIRAERDAGRDVEKFINSSNKFNSTPLYIAAKFGNKGAVEWFLDQ